MDANSPASGLPRELLITSELLRLANMCRTTEDLLREAATFFRKHAGCDAVGVRLQEGDDYPYYQTEGFSADFVRLERHLCERDADGRPRRDSSGNPVLECMCGSVICGRFDPTKPFFTAKGSFWTNSTSRLLAGTTEADRQARTRNRCHGEGYESVALIPLRCGDERLGLLQLNDRRPGQFTREKVLFWERLADQLAVAISKLRAAEALRESEDRFRMLIQTMAEGMVLHEMVWDEADGRAIDYRILDCNAAFERQTGLSAAQARGRLGSEFYGTTPAPFLDVYAEVTRTGRSRSFDAFFEPLQRHFLISAFAPRPGWFATVFLDLTERKRAEELARQQQVQLAHLARVASVGEMMSGLAHELNQPLGAILNYASVCDDLLAGGNPRPDTLRKAVTALSGEAQRASEIVRRVRTFAQKQEQHRFPADIADIVRQAIDLMGFELRRAGIRVSEECAKDVPGVAVDRVQIQQVLVNLMQNAIDAMADVPAERRRLTIRASSGDGGHVRVEVEDGGRGMPDSIRGRVFEPFVTTKQDGLGLGLPISRTIIEGHGGRLEALPGGDHGSTFRFTLPVARG